MADKTVPLTMALAKIKALQPTLFADLENALRAYAEPEVDNVLSAAPTVVLIAQGRAQLAKELLKITADCGGKALQYHQQLQMKGV